MKNLTILFFVILLNAISVFAQEFSYSPFQINETKSSSPGNVLKEYVDDAKIVDVNFTIVNTIINNRSENITVKIPFNGSELQVKLKRFEILKDDAIIVSGTESGDRIEKISHNFIAYTSNLDDKNSPLVVITFFRDNVSALIISNSETLVMTKKKDSGNFIMYQSSKLKIQSEFKCGAEELEIPGKINELKKELNGNVNSLASNTLLRANIAIESDYEFYTFWGNSTERASNYILSLYVPVSALYSRDINVQLQIGYLRVWTISGDPYPDATSSNTLLTSFRNYWNGNMQSTQRTIAHFISTRPGGLGGIAYLNVLCASTSSGFGYAFSDIDGTFNQIPVYSWDVMVVAHETGHNFGSPHTHSCTWPGGPIDSCYTVEGGCYSGPQIPRVGTIMSYCHLNASIALNFGPLPSQLIRNYAESAGCMNPVTGYQVAYPNTFHIFRSGTTIPIIWGTSNTGLCNIEYTTNNGTTWVTIQNNVDALLRTYTWTIPYIPTTTQARVRVYETGNTANSDISDSTFQIRPLLNNFTLLSPEQQFRTTVSTGDTSVVNFISGKSGTLPELKYKWSISTLNNSFSSSVFTNNSGNDTVYSITRHKLDSIVTAWGAPNIGDSLRIRWTIKCYSQLDSLNASSTYLMTLTRSVIGIEPISSVIPDKFFVNPNYPNPFNPETKIKFGLPANADVKISVYDMLGREVDILVNSKLEAGEYMANWNAVNFSSGIYIYRIEAKDVKGNRFTETKRMVLIK